MQKNQQNFEALEQYESAFEEYMVPEINPTTTPFSKEWEYENPFVDRELEEGSENEHYYFEHGPTESFEYEGSVAYPEQPFTKSSDDESALEEHNPAQSDHEEYIMPFPEDQENMEAYAADPPQLFTHEITERSRQLAKKFGITTSVLHSYDWAFKKKWSPKFIALVQWAAKLVDINPGLLATNLIAETFATDYLGGPISSFVVGTDDFYAKRAELAQKVPAYKSIAWKRAGDLTDVNEKGRTVDSVMFSSGKDALLASAVYLKHGELALKDIALSLGKRFDAIPVETRFALTRLAFNAGHGRAGKNLREYLNLNKSVLVPKPQKKSGPQRMATIRTAQAIHISETFFSAPIKLISNEEHEGEISLEADYDTEKENVALESLITTVNTPTCTIDAAKKNAIGFEFDLLLNLTADVRKARTLADGVEISKHTSSSDGFVLKIDGNKIEVSTKPFPLTDAGKKELTDAFANIDAWITKVKTSLRTKQIVIENSLTAGCNCVAGKGIYVETTDVGAALNLKDAFITPVHFIVPLKTAIANRADYYTTRIEISGVPQATMGIPLASVNKLVNIIRNSEGDAVGVGLSGPAGTRLGIRSDALYNAQYRVLKARQFFLKTGSYNSLTITTKNFTESLAGFLILLAEYMWTGVLPEDPRDHEPFSKAYIPLHSKTRFRDMFHCLLNDNEREVFAKVFYEGDNWKNLYSLAKKIPGRPGGLVSVTGKTGNKLYTSKVSPRPDWRDFIQAIVENRFDLEKETGSDTLVSGPTKVIPLKANGVVVELRRMGFGVLPSGNWLKMSTRLFDIAKSLNA